MKPPFPLPSDRDRINFAIAEGVEWYAELGLPIDIKRIEVKLNWLPWHPSNPSYGFYSNGDGLLKLHFATGRKDIMFDHFDIAHELGHACTHQHVPNLSDIDGEFVAITMQCKRISDLGYKGIMVTTDSAFHQAALDRVRLLGPIKAYQEVLQILKK